MRCVMILFMLALPFCACKAAQAEDMGSTARGMFALLPTSIFEITPEGLSDSDKQELLNKGSSEFWEISSETPDEMVFTSLPLRERNIGLRVFRNDQDGSTEVAMGTLGEPICALELWRMDMAGRIVPVDAPEEPEAGEFFNSRRKLPKNIRHSILVCLDHQGLEARPLFWNLEGMVEARPDNHIFYVWTGHRFEKQARRH